MTFSNELKRYAELAWGRRRASLGDLAGEAERVLRECTAEEAVLLTYVMGTLPLSDLGDYGPAFFLGFVRHALRVREEFSWCRALPERLFLRDVLYPRINTEGLADCRDLFHGALADRVRGLALPEAILEVNRWCAEEATYRSTDDRTASPLAVFRCGWGRCGEESVFALTALRSVGIAARQVYAPWWSHCDDNHAWVEAFDGTAWRFLGACEPEPVLDRGWFTGAASRAMMVHTRSFVQGPREDWAFLFPDAEEDGLNAEHGVAYETVTARYARTKRITVTVRGTEGRPVPGTRVSCSILNMAGFLEIASRRTDRGGRAVLRLGQGSVRIEAESGGRYAETLLDAGRADAAELVLGEPARPGGTWEAFDFHAPADAPIHPGVLTPEQKRARRECLDRTSALRERKMVLHGHGTEERTDGGEELCARRRRVWETLTEKDRAGGVAEAVLSDAEAAFEWEREFSPEVFENGLLSPRVGLEPLFPWREELSATFSGAMRAELRAQPARVWDWVARNVREEGELYPSLPGSPKGTFRLKAGNAEARKTLFCALCRSLGVPARLSPEDGIPEYFADGAFHPLYGGAKTARLTLAAPEGQPGLSRQNYTLARYTGSGYESLRTGDIPAGGCLEIPLAAGRYRLLTVNRMPGGGQLAQKLDLWLSGQEERRVLLEFRQGKTADMLERCALPPFSLKTDGGAETEGAGVLERSPLSLLCFLEVNREPTEHILNELREAAEKFRAVSGACNVHLVLEGPECRGDPTLSRTLAELPGAEVWYGDFPDAVPALARRMYVDPDRLPLVLLADRNGDGLYACSGYNVGTAELLLRMIGELTKPKETNGKENG